MDAIVMAAGEGRRMRPLTDRYAKPVLPIDGRPVIAALLRELAAAGVERATVVVGHLGEQVRTLVGDGRAFGLDVSYADQPRVDGSADAVHRGLAAGALAPALLTAADTLYAPGSVAAFVGALSALSAQSALAVVRGRVPAAAKPGVRLADDLVRTVYDLDPALPFTAAPLWLLGDAVVPHLEGVPGPPFELKDAFQRAIDAGVAVAAVEIPRPRDLTTPFDTLVENFPYLAPLD